VSYFLFLFSNLMSDSDQSAFTVTYGDASQMQGVLAYDVVTMGTKSALAVIGRIESSRAIGGGAGLFEVGGLCS
jgi:hypothetical protein